ncbi:MAG: hypothetical protein ACOY37_12935 [Pseudomonadota bacterium]
MDRQPSWRAIVLAAALGFAPAAPAGQPLPRNAAAEPPPTAEETRQETEETARRMEATPAERRAELRALARTADRLAEKRLKELQTDVSRDWSRLGVQSRERARAAMEAAGRERKRFAAEAKKLDADSSAAWVELRAGVVAAYRDLAHAVSNARSEFTRARDEKAGDKPRTHDQHDQEETP